MKSPTPVEVTAAAYRAVVVDEYGTMVAIDSSTGALRRFGDTPQGLPALPARPAGAFKGLTSGCALRAGAPSPQQTTLWSARRTAHGYDTLSTASAGTPPGKAWPAISSSYATENAMTGKSAKKRRLS